jgi:hypothetical protein
MSFFQAVTGARVTGQNIVTSGLVFNIDASESASYPGTGTTWYDIAGSNVGTLTNGASYVSSPKSIEFDGVDDYVTFGSITSSNPLSLAGDTSYTIEVWFKGDTSGEDLARVFEKGNGPSFAGGYGIFCTDNSTPRLRGWSHLVNGAAYYSPNPMWTEGVWCQMVLTRNGTSIYIYNNTTYMANGALSANTAPPTTTADFYVAAAPWTTARDMAGSVGAIRIYNRVLTTTEIAQNFNARRARYGV